MRRSDLHIQLEIMRLIGIDTLPTNILYYTKVSWTTFKMHIKFLELYKYVVKVECDDFDKRTHYIYELTPAGKDFLTKYYMFAVNYPIMPQIEDDFITFKRD